MCKRCVVEGPVCVCLELVTAYAPCTSSYQAVLCLCITSTLEEKVLKPSLVTALVWSPRPSSRQMCILDIDVQGAQQVKASPHLSALFIFVEPPSFEELERRLRGRWVVGVSDNWEFLTAIVSLGIREHWLSQFTHAGQLSVTPPLCPLSEAPRQKRQCRSAFATPRQSWREGRTGASSATLW